MFRSQIHLISLTFSQFLFLETTELKVHVRKPGGTQGSPSSITSPWKIIVWILYYYHIFETSKLGNVDTNVTILEGTAIKCDVESQ